MRSAASKRRPGSAHGKGASGSGERLREAIPLNRVGIGKRNGPLARPVGRSLVGTSETGLGDLLGRVELHDIAFRGSATDLRSGASKIRQDRPHGKGAVLSGVTSGEALMQEGGAWPLLLVRTMKR